MTIRAVLLGLLGAMLVAVVAYLNDHVWVLNSFIGYHLPIFVFGSLVVAALVVNPLLFLVNRRWRLAPRELAVVVTMMLVSCSIPSYGFLGMFTKSQAMPTNAYRTREGWQKNKLREYVPSHMLAAEGKYVKEFTDSAMTGAGAKDEAISLGEVPWRFWSESLTTWVPLVVLMSVAAVCLGLIFHRQWSVAERLRYPIAEIATVFMDQDRSRASPSLFRTNAFWWGLGIVLFIRVSNGVLAWYPGKWINIPMMVDFGAIPWKWQSIPSSDYWSWFWFSPTIYPTIIAIAFLLATDVSFSVGIAPIAFTGLSWYLLQKYGFSLAAADAGDYMIGGPAIWQRFGSYLALALVIGYTGRRYYGDVLKRALTFRQSADAESYAAWACRFLLLAVAAMILLLTMMGLPWAISTLSVMLALLVFLGISRVNCESGMFVNLPRWQPLGVLLGLFGATAMGPEAVIVVGLFCMLFTVQPLESLMTFFMNGLRMCSGNNIKPARVAKTAMSTYLIVLVVAIPVVLWAVHNYGLRRGNWEQRWSTVTMPYYYYDAGDKIVTELKNDGTLTESEQLTPFERLKRMEPDRKFLWAAGLGAAGVLVLSFLRLRLPWWPIHPIIFILWGTRQTAEVGASFLLGWAIKSGVTKLGGTQTYKTTRKVMFGAIAGDLIGALIFMLIDMAYYNFTGRPPKQYIFFPIMN